MPTCTSPSERSIHPATNLGVALLLVALAASSRLLHLPPNVSAVAGVALFAGFYFRSTLLAVGLPVIAMVISDTFLGGYSWKEMLVVYAAICLPALFGKLLSRIRPGALSVLACAAAGSVTFFLTTNLAVWAFSGEAVYPKTADGLAECFAYALPFFRYTFAGDLITAAALFGAYRLLTRPRAILPSPVAA